jgi:hypothetical protein
MGAEWDVLSSDWGRNASYFGPVFDQAKPVFKTTLIFKPRMNASAPLAQW